MDTKVGRAEVSTSYYEFAHGKRPRGYGAWAFDFKGGKAQEGAEPFWAKDERGFPAMNYGAAVKVARARAKELGAHTIVVLS